MTVQTTATSARILAEVDHDADVTCVLTPPAGEFSLFVLSAFQSFKNDLMSLPIVKAPR